MPRGEGFGSEGGKTVSAGGGVPTEEQIKKGIAGAASETSGFAVTHPEGAGITYVGGVRHIKTPTGLVRRDQAKALSEAEKVAFGFKKKPVVAKIIPKPPVIEKPEVKLVYWGAKGKRVEVTDPLMSPPPGVVFYSPSRKSYGVRSVDSSGRETFKRFRTREAAEKGLPLPSRIVEKAPIGAVRIDEPTPKKSSVVSGMSAKDIFETPEKRAIVTGIAGRREKVVKATEERAIKRGEAAAFQRYKEWVEEGKPIVELRETGLKVTKKQLPGGEVLIEAVTPAVARPPGGLKIPEDIELKQIWKKEGLGKALDVFTARRSTEPIGKLITKRTGLTTEKVSKLFGELLETTTGVKKIGFAGERFVKGAITGVKERPFTTLAAVEVGGIAGIAVGGGASAISARRALKAIETGKKAKKAGKILTVLRKPVSQTALKTLFVGGLVAPTGIAAVKEERREPGKGYELVGRELFTRILPFGITFKKGIEFGAARGAELFKPRVTDVKSTMAQTTKTLEAKMNKARLDLKQKSAQFDIETKLTTDTKFKEFLRKHVVTKRGWEQPKVVRIEAQRLADLKTKVQFFKEPKGDLAREPFVARTEFTVAHEKIPSLEKLNLGQKLRKAKAYVFDDELRHAIQEVKLVRTRFDKGIKFDFMKPEVAVGKVRTIPKLEGFKRILEGKGVGLEPLKRSKVSLWVQKQTEGVIGTVGGQGQAIGAFRAETFRGAKTFATQRGGFVQATGKLESKKFIETLTRSVGTADVTPITTSITKKGVRELVYGKPFPSTFDVREWSKITKPGVTVRTTGIGTKAKGKDVLTYLKDFYAKQEAVKLGRVLVAGAEAEAVTAIGRVPTVSKGLLHVTGIPVVGLRRVEKPVTKVKPSVRKVSIVGVVPMVKPSVVPMVKRLEVQRKKQAQAVKVTTPFIDVTKPMQLPSVKPVVKPVVEPAVKRIQEEKQKQEQAVKVRQPFIDAAKATQEAQRQLEKNMLGTTTRTKTAQQQIQEQLRVVVPIQAQVPIQVQAQKAKQVPAVHFPLIEPPSIPIIIPPPPDIDFPKKKKKKKKKKLVGLRVRRLRRFPIIGAEEYLKKWLGTTSKSAGKGTVSMPKVKGLSVKPLFKPSKKGKTKPLWLKRVKR